MPVVVYRDPLFLRHDPGAGHPENARRLEAVYASLDAKPLEGVRAATPRDATEAEILRLHDARHVERVMRTAGQAHVQGRPLFINPERPVLVVKL